MITGIFVTCAAFAGVGVALGAIEIACRIVERITGWRLL